jgi:hypothetical protein
MDGLIGSYLTVVELSGEPRSSAAASMLSHMRPRLTSHVAETLLFEMGLKSAPRTSMLCSAFTLVNRFHTRSQTDRNRSSPARSHMAINCQLL